MDPADARAGQVPAFSALSPSILDREDRERAGRQVLAVLQHHLGNDGLRDAHVLDLGCSSGVITSILAAASGSAVGVDVDTAALQRARAEYPHSNVQFLKMDADALAFPTASFDVVICHQMYYWLPDPAKLFAEIHRVLKPGGVCLLAAVNRYKLVEAQYRLPLLSVVPRRVADVMVRMAGKGNRFPCRYLSFWGLREACSDFVIHRYTSRIIKDPLAFSFVRLSFLKRGVAALPLRWCEALEPLSPNFIWILEKSR